MWLVVWMLMLSWILCERRMLSIEMWISHQWMGVGENMGEKRVFVADVGFEVDGCESVTDWESASKTRWLLLDRL